MGRLDSKTAVVTAAAQGIGRATALAFAAEGAQVAATDINMDKLSEIQGVPNVAVRWLDVRDGAAVEALAGEIASPDVLFNCAGFVHHGSVLEASEADWDFSFDLNVKSMFRTVRAFLPGMLVRGSGAIINVASNVSSLHGVPNRCVYGATKAAVIGFTKAVAADFIDRGVRCNAIAPGTIQSPSLEERIAALDNPEQARRDFIARQPMGRLGSAEEIAALAVYLASDESAFTTGTVMVADGGATL